MFDNQGLALSSKNAEAVAVYNRAVAELLDYRMSAMPTLKQCLELDSDFCMAHCLRGYMLMMLNTAKMHGPAAKEYAEVKRLVGSANDRERMHAMALGWWVDGDLPRLCAQWEAIVTKYPLDIVALRLHHFVSFWMGRTQQLITLPASAKPAWNSGIPNYGNVLGMMAFGLEEMGCYAEAETHGREAVELNGNDLWAIHSVAHVLEMQGRHKDGLKWLDYPSDVWADRNPFRGHVWWHRGLFLIADQRLDEAMKFYDDVIYDTTSTYFLDLQNAVAFLSRLEFAGKNVGPRWEVLAGHASAMKGDHELVFTDLNNVIALGHARKFDAARDYIASMKTRIDEKDNYVAQVLRRVGVPICEGLLAYEEGQYEKALETLTLYKPLLIEVGASPAQRDLVSLFALDAAKRGGKSETLQHLQWEREFMTRLAQPHAA